MRLITAICVMILAAGEGHGSGVIDDLSPDTQQDMRRSALNASKLFYAITKEQSRFLRRGGGAPETGDETARQVDRSTYLLSKLNTGLSAAASWKGLHVFEHGWGGSLELDYEGKVNAATTVATAGCFLGSIIGPLCGTSCTAGALIGCGTGFGLTCLKSAYVTPAKPAAANPFALLPDTVSPRFDLIAYNENRILIAFRGEGEAEASTKNGDPSYLQDLYSFYPTERGTERLRRFFDIPLVATEVMDGGQVKLHRKFLWEAMSAQEEILECLRTYIHGKQLSYVNVMVTGHGFGGAIATIMSTSLKIFLEEEVASHGTPYTLNLMTFGAPNVFSREAAEIFTRKIQPTTVYRVNTTGGDSNKPGLGLLTDIMADKFKGFVPVGEEASIIVLENLDMYSAMPWAAAQLKLPLPQEEEAMLLKKLLHDINLYHKYGTLNREAVERRNI